MPRQRKSSDSGTDADAVPHNKMAFYLHYVLY